MTDDAAPSSSSRTTPRPARSSPTTSPPTATSCSWRLRARRAAALETKSPRPRCCSISGCPTVGVGRAAGASAPRTASPSDGPRTPAAGALRPRGRGRPAARLRLRGGRLRLQTVLLPGAPGADRRAAAPLPRAPIRWGAPRRRARDRSRRARRRGCGAAASSCRRRSSRSLRSLAAVAHARLIEGGAAADGLGRTGAWEPRDA